MPTREVGIHFAKTKNGVQKWKAYYRKRGYGSKVSKASKAIQNIDGTKYVITRGKKLKKRKR